MSLTLIGRCLVLGLALSLAACNSSGKDSAARTLTESTAENVRASRITGQVTLTGLADASGIQVYVPGTNLISITDRQGHFALEGVGAGSYDVLARFESYEPATVGQVVVIPTTKTDYALAAVALNRRARAAGTTSDLSAFGSIRGKVTGGAGADLTRCTIELDKTPYRTNCAADGSFFLWNLPPDQYHLAARVEGYQPAAVNVRVLPGPDATTVAVPLTMPAALPTGDRRIHGTVELIVPGGKPDTDYAKVTVQAVGRPDLTTKPLADGSFQMLNLAPARYQLTATAPGYAPAKPVDVDLTAMTEMTVQLTLTAGGETTRTMTRLHGVAMKNVENEENMSGITVALAGTSFNATTDEMGQYAIDNIPPGSYRLLAQAQGFRSAEQGPVTLKAGDDLEVEGMLLEPIRDYPEVIETTPNDGARNVTVRREMPLMVRFSKKMDPASLRAAITLEPAAAFRVYTGKEQPDTDFDLAKIIIYGAGQDPAARFRTRYTLTISEEAKDFEGLTLQAPFSMSFTTGDPSVVGTLPENRGVLTVLSPGGAVQVQFNATMEHETLTPDSLRIQPALDSTPNLSAVEDPQTGWTQLNISATWRPDTRYRITVLRRARTVGKNSLSNTPYTYTFRTVKLNLYQQPSSPEGLNR